MRIVALETLVGVGSGCPAPADGVPVDESPGGVGGAVDTVGSEGGEQVGAGFHLDGRRQGSLLVSSAPAVTDVPE